jgi:hypothetical protein
MKGMEKATNRKVMWKQIVWVTIEDFGGEF